MAGLCVLGQGSCETSDRLVYGSCINTEGQLVTVHVTMMSSLCNGVCVLY